MNVYDFVKEQEVKYQKPIQLEDGWDWSMKDHLRRSFLYKNSQFEQENENRDLRPNKNIVLAIRNIENRTEGFDVKDVELYVDNPDEFYKSFLVRKYHEKWALENSIDTFIDDMVDSYGDYGGVLVRDADENRPKVIDLRGLAFCNQKNILANPFCIKHEFSPAELREQEDWGKEGATMDIERLIQICKDEESIIVYELIGTLLGDWLGNDKNGESIAKKKDEQQIQVIAYYKDQNKNEIGVTLFRHKLPDLPFKFLARDKIVGRALGRGGIEELFEAQIWTNWDEVKITEMLEAASKILFKSTDPSFKTQNLSNLDNLEVLNLKSGDIAQLDTTPRNLAVFNDAMTRWEAHAQQLGAASEGMLGESPSSGTPFKLYEAQNIEAKSMHRFRQGQIAAFMDEIYRDWILPHIAKEIVQDQTFLAELSADEMQQVAESLINNISNKFVKDKILSGELVNPEEIAAMKDTARENFMKSNKKFIKLLKKDFQNTLLAVRTNIAGKQKNLALLTDKLVNVLRQFLSTPQIRQDPEMVKLLNVILESSGMSPMMFGSAPMQAQPAQGGTEPLKEFAELKAKEPMMV